MIRALAAAIVVVAATVVATGALVRVQQRDLSVAEKPENFSPLGFEDLRAYQEAFPGTPGSLAVVRAAASKYWIFRGLAYRGSDQAQGSAWTSLGPLSLVQDPASGSGQNISGRVAALAIDPNCARQGGCRLWVGPAGGGVWRTE